MTTQTARRPKPAIAKASRPPAVAIDLAAPGRPPASEDEIRLRAYHLWDSAGKPPGDGTVFWLAAEQELRLAK